MIIFLISVLLLTLLSLWLFIVPVLSARRGKMTLKRRIYIVFVAFLFTICVPVFYGLRGAPDMRDYPLASRNILSFENAPEKMARIRRMERYVAENADDGVIWEALGEAYRKNGQYAQAAFAYRNAIEFGVPQDIRNWHALAETLIQANNGRIVAEAQKAFENVLRYRPDNAKALYFLGLARLQNKDPHRALALWRYLEQRLSENDPWLIVISERIRVLSKALNVAPETIAPQAPKTFVR